MTSSLPFIELEKLSQYVLDNYAERFTSEDDCTHVIDEIIIQHYRAYEVLFSLGHDVSTVAKTYRGLGYNRHVLQATVVKYLNLKE